MISEISQMEKEKYHTISLICESLKKEKNKIIDTKMRLVIVTRGEVGKMNDWNQLYSDG